MRRLAILVALLAFTSPAFAALTQVTSFGSNPGALQMFEYVPAGLPSGRPLVVVLHGCTQTAAAMENAGWNKLADQYQFAVLYPQQQSANNPVSCFNWAGEYGDTANLVRGQGENQSIIEMIDKMKTSHGIDTTKVYLAGFSAGGGFASVMLATWPERFAAAAIMEGIAYRCATTVNGAYSCQSPGVTHTPKEWGDLVRGAATYTGPRPRVQIWEGSSDTTVVPANQTELVKQWTDVFGTDQTADENETFGSAGSRAAYKLGSTIVVESYTVTGMAHAVSVGAEGSATCPGSAGAYFEGKPLCSTLRAAKFFGLVPGSGSGGGGGPGTGVDGTPNVSIVSPADGSSATGQLTVVVAAGDDVGVANVTLEIDGQPVGTPDTEAPYQFDWNATAAGNGTHMLEATATDSAGNTATATAMVTVPGPGGGNGSNGAGDDDGDSYGDLPACSLDAGRHGAGGGTWAPIVGALVAIVTLGRRRRARGSAR